MNDMLRIGTWLLIGLLCAAAPASAAAERACLDAIGRAERSASWLPSGLLRSIALIESGHRPAGTGGWVPWPWTINSAAGSFYLDSRAEAVAKVEALQAQGLTNIDVGCMQINLHYHPDAFRSLEEAFRPDLNVAYAVGFLRTLRGEARTLFDAVGRYHSRTPQRRDAYARRVFARWDADGAMAPPSAHGLGEPDSPVLVRPAEPVIEGGATRVWRGVYGARPSSGRLVEGGTASWSLTGSTRLEPTAPRAPGQIQLR